jgi:transposase
MYSIEIRKLIINLYIKIKSLRKVQSLIGISRSTISRWNISIFPSLRNNKINILSPVIIDVVELIYKINPFFTIADVQNHLKNACGISCSKSLINIVFRKKMNLSYKKPKFINCPNEQNIKIKTDLFINNFKKYFKHNSTIVSFDEVGFSSKIKPISSWSIKGIRNYIKIKTPLKDRTNKSVCSYITNKGEIKYNIENKPFNKISFLEFLKSIDLPIYTIILLDNVSFHHSKCIVDYAKEKKWILLYTPPYSPWFNPIENVFSVIKNHFRKYQNIPNAFNHVSNKIIINCINSVIKRILSY